MHYIGMTSGIYSKCEGKTLPKVGLLGLVALHSPLQTTHYPAVNQRRFCVHEDIPEFRE